MNTFKLFLIFCAIVGVLMIIFRYFWWLILLLGIFAVIGYYRTQHLVNTRNLNDDVFFSQVKKKQNENSDIIDVEVTEHEEKK